MIKLICAMLALVMCLSLIGCNAASEDTTTAAPDTTAANTTAAVEDTTAAQETEDLNAFDPAAAEPVIGSWTAKAYVNLSVLALDGVEGTVSVPMMLNFDDQGAYSITLDVNAFVSAATEKYVQVLAQAQYAQLAQQEMEKEAADQWMQENYGMTVEEYVRADADLVDYTSAIMDLEFTGSYRVEGDKIILDADAEEAETISFQADEDALTLQETDRQARWKKLGVKLALKLTKAEK